MPLAISAAFFLLVLLPSLSPHYGFYSDELYYLACARRLDLGYVDHPPLFVWALRLHAEIFGDSLFALRALPAAAGAAAAFLTGWMARRLGGGIYAQVLAALAFCSGLALAIFGIFTVNCLALLWWAVGCWILVERCRREEPRLWLALGLVLGIAFLTKHTILVFVAGLGAAKPLTPLRRELATRWPWLGALAFALLAAPNLWWQIANDWPSLEFYLRRGEFEVRLSPLRFLSQQILVQNPATLPLWLGGLWFFLRSPGGERFRPLGVLFLAVLAIGTIAGSSIPYRVAGVFPAAFAGGAVLLEAIRRPDAGPLRRLWNTYTLPALLLLTGGIAATAALPILPPETVARHPLWDGTDDWRPQVGPEKLPYHLANRTHWRDLVDDVSRVHAGLDEERRSGAIILADYFGHAGAIEYYGKGLPPVYSPHTGYFLWGPPPGSPDPVIAIGVDEELLRRHFESVTVGATFRCEWCPLWQDELPIHVARGPKRPFAELWPELGRIGGMDLYRRRLRAAGIE